MGRLHTSTNGGTMGQTREVENPKTVVVRIVPLQLDLHEVGIASNRGSACHGEYVPGLVYTARHTMGVGTEVGV